MDFFDLTDAHFVYLLTDGQFVKVGRAMSVCKRIKLLQTGCPRKIEPVMEWGPFLQREAVEIERSLHSLMAPFRSYGEWFSCSIDEACAALILLRGAVFKKGGFCHFKNKHKKTFFKALCWSDAEVSRLTLRFKENKTPDSLQPATVTGDGKTRKKRDPVRLR